ncbi:MAG: DUF2291 domain-containing protein [Methylobacteriaceae bacterium]|jgi:predicted lipoprotein|nr:DUF2291 domain-containing protein [Methylobacteriaceae bacterium]
MKRLGILCACILMVPLLGGWKIVSKEELVKIYEGEKLPELSAKTYLEEGIRPYALKTAHPAPEVLKAIDEDFDKACKAFGFRHSESAFPCNFWMEIKGSVVKLDTKSQSGRAWVLPEGVPPDAADEEAGTIILLIGPAIDSMGPRDGYPELKYEQFNDQTKFGAFGREINRLLSDDIRARVSDLEKGSMVDVIGVLSTWDKPWGNAEVVPVAFK